MENDNVDEHLTWILHSEQVAREADGAITRNDLNYNNRYGRIHIPAARPQGEGSRWSLETPPPPDALTRRSCSSLGYNVNETIS